MNCKDKKDNKQLRSFADILRSCHDTLRAMKCDEELSGGRALLKIFEKLPDDLKRRWLTENYEITESGRLPRMEDVVKLVEKEQAKELNLSLEICLTKRFPLALFQLHQTLTSQRSSRRLLFQPLTSLPHLSALRRLLPTGAQDVLKVTSSISVQGLEACLFQST